MSFYQLFKGLSLFQADPLTQKARQIVTRELLAEAKRCAAEAQNSIELHNHVDLYFGGQDQRPPASDKRLRRAYLKQFLHDKPMRQRVAAARAELIRQSPLPPESDIAPSLSLKTGLKNASVWL